MLKNLYFHHKSFTRLLMLLPETNRILPELSRRQDELKKRIGCLNKCGQKTAKQLYYYSESALYLTLLCLAKF